MKTVTYGVYWWYKDGSPAGCLSVTTRYDAEYWCNEMEEAGFPAAWVLIPN